MILSVSCSQDIVSGYENAKLEKCKTPAPKKLLGMLEVQGGHIPCLVACLWVIATNIHVSIHNYLEEMVFKLNLSFGANEK